MADGRLAAVTGAKLSCINAMQGPPGPMGPNPAPDFISTHEASFTGHECSVATTSDAMVGVNIFPFYFGCKLKGGAPCVPTPMADFVGPWFDVHPAEDGGSDILLKGSYFICATGNSKVKIGSPGQATLRLEQPSPHGEGGVEHDFSPINEDKLEGSNNRWGRENQGAYEYDMNGSNNPFNWTRTDGQSTGWQDASNGQFEWGRYQNFVTAQGTIYQGEIGALTHADSVWGGNIDGRFGNLQADVLGYETTAGYGLNIGDDGLEATVNGSAQAYLGRVQYNVSHGPVDAAAQAYVGAKAEGAAELKFNPLNGQIEAEIGGEVFIGAKAEAEVTVGNDNAAVTAHGGVSYGLGAQAHAEVGFDGGVVDVEFNLGATLGLGVEFGVDVEVDVVETAKDIGNGVKDLTGKLSPWW